jgi:hypothetical protein
MQNQSHKHEMGLRKKGSKKETESLNESREEEEEFWWRRIKRASTSP